MERFEGEKMAKIGERVPDLEMEVLHEGEIKKVRLSDYAGKWLVLVFYPADFTFVCPTELEDMERHYAQFREAGAEVISMSTDTVFVHKAWKDNSEAIGKIEYPMGADPSGRICRAFGTYIEDEGVSLRGSFIIDPDGTLKAFEVHDNSIGRSAKELLRKLRAADFVRKSDGLVCPANWEPGAETLKPGLGLVGKI